MLARVLILALVSLPAFAGQPIYGVGPSFGGAPAGTAQTVFDTEAYVCSRGWSTAVWSPQYYQPALPDPIYIKKVRVWVGADYDFIGDIGFSLYATSGGQSIYIDDMGWDHYTNIKGFEGQARETSWNGDYIRLSNTDTLTLGWGCNHFAGSGPAMRVRVAIWYTLAP